MVWVELLSAPSCEETVARAVVELDAQVHYRDDKVGYVLLRIARSKLLDVLDLRGLDAATIPSLVILPTADPRLDDQGRSRAFLRSCCRSHAWPRRYRRDGPYFPAAEAGLTDLWTTHPDADGRGVRIAAVDDGFDLLHPAMLQARDTAGAIVPKVAALDATTLPEIDDNWVTFGAPIREHGRCAARGGPRLAFRQTTHRVSAHPLLASLPARIGSASIVTPSRSVSSSTPRRIRSRKPR